jgi:hypothetical protein
MQIGDFWMSTQQLVEYSGYAKSTLEKLRCYGGGPRFYKRRGKVYYRRLDVDRWMKGVETEKAA